MGRSTAAASPATFHQRIRWWSYFNTTRETIPPYACMMLRGEPDSPGGSYPTHICQEQRQGEVVWQVAKCDDDAESWQNPAQFMFNGPNACPPRSTLFGHFDFPAQVLHDGRSDSLPNGYPCGPVADKWYVLQGRPAFSCRSHDATGAAHGGGGGGIHTVWLDRGSTDTGFHCAGNVTAETYDEDSWLTWDSDLMLNRGCEVAADGWLTVNFSGLWDFRFSGTLYGPPEAERGDTLWLHLYERTKEGVVSATPWNGYRKHDVERDQYGNDILTTEENVAFGGLVNLRKGAAIRLRNVGENVHVSSGIFTMVRKFAYFETDLSRSGSLL